MKSIKALGLASAFLTATFSLVSCASTSRTQAVAGTSDRQFHYVTDSVYNRLIQISQSDAPDEEKFRSIEQVFCSGRKGRFNITYKIRDVNRVIAGLPTDIAARDVKNVSDRIRSYLKNEFYKDASYVNDSSSDFAYKAAFVRYFASELDFLRRNFLYQLPKSEVEKVHAYERRYRGWTHETNYRTFGYSEVNSDQEGEDGEFKASLALLGAEEVFDRMLAYQTTLREAATTDGTKYEVILSFDSFCQYAHPRDHYLSTN